jgi:hypothetical protein
MAGRVLEVGRLVCSADLAEVVPTGEDVPDAGTSRERDLVVTGGEWRVFDGMGMAWTRSTWGD